MDVQHDQLGSALPSRLKPMLHLAMSALGQKRTSDGHHGMSAKCQERTSLSRTSEYKLADLCVGVGADADMLLP